MNWRIVTGYYITALGQESERYYFKTTDETIKVGDVGLTFYQNNLFGRRKFGKNYGFKSKK